MSILSKIMCIDTSSFKKLGFFKTSICVHLAFYFFSGTRRFNTEGKPPISNIVMSLICTDRQQAGYFCCYLLLPFEQEFLFIQLLFFVIFFFAKCNQGAKNFFGKFSQLTVFFPRHFALSTGC